MKLLKRTVIKILFSLCLLGLASSCINKVAAQVTVYKTYDEYKNNTGKEYDNSYGYYGMSGSDAFGGFIVYFNNEKSGKLEIKCGQVWGFKYDGRLFRTGPKDAPFWVRKIGKLCFYGNGHDELPKIRGGSESNVILAGAEDYVSKDLQSKLVVFPIHDLKKLPAALKEARRQFPEANELLDCIGAATISEDIDDCINKLDK
jgi:hypothetical protein